MAKGGITRKSFGISPQVIEQIKKHIKKIKQSSIAGHLIDTLPDSIEGHQHLKIVLIKREDSAKNFSFLLDLQQCLGQGAQGKVFLGLNLENNGLIAIKVHQSNAMGAELDIQTERQNLARCKRLIGIAQDQEGNHYTLMDYYSGYNLLQLLYEIDHQQSESTREYFKAKKEIDIFLKLRLAIEVIKQAIELHDQNLLHRDVKTANFISDIHGFLHEAGETLYHIVNLKLIDLGCAIPLENGVKDKSIYGSPGYVDPIFAHQLMGEKKPYTVANDFFSFGVVIAEIFTSHNYQHAIIDQLNRISREEKFKREFTLDEIQGMMPDMFDKGSGNNFPLTQEGTERLILENIKEVVAQLFSKDLAERPNSDGLKVILANLKALLFKSTIELNCIHPNSSFRNFQRLKTVGTQSLSGSSVLPKEEKPTAAEEVAIEHEKNAEKPVITRGYSEMHKRCDESPKEQVNDLSGGTVAPRLSQSLKQMSLVSSESMHTDPTFKEKKLFFSTMLEKASSKKPVSHSPKISKLSKKN